MAATLTVLTVSFNAREDFKLTAGSLPRHLPPWLNWVVVDGNSTDGTVDAIQSESRVTRWISESDRGVYDAYNKAWRLAETPFVLFLNCGDTLSTIGIELLTGWHDQIHASRC
jgi:putative colanic acid biosynthesis glycosyltransferase